MSGLSIGALGVGLLTADEAWAAVEERTNRFGIVPGTLVDSEGHPIDRASIGNELFIGEVMLVGFNFAPRGCAVCQGQLLPIASNTALFFSLGNDRWRERAHASGLPDLRGRAALSSGSGPGLSPRPLGQRSKSP